MSKRLKPRKAFRQFVKDFGENNNTRGGDVIPPTFFEPFLTELNRNFINIVKNKL